MMPLLEQRLPHGAGALRRRAVRQLGWRQEEMLDRGALDELAGEVGTVLQAEAVCVYDGADWG